MKLLSYGLDHRMEPRLALSINGYAVDVMRASLWMKRERNAQDYLTLPSSMRLALEDWDHARPLLETLQKALQGLDLDAMKTNDRPVAMLESEIAFFSPVPDPPSLRLFQVFDPEAPQRFAFGNTQTLFGHGQPIPFGGLVPSPEMAAVISNPRGATQPEIAGFCIVNNWEDPEADANCPGSKKGVATSLGPYLVTGDELEHAKLGLGWNMAVSVTMNKQPVGEGRFKSMGISFEDMLHLAARTNLLAGDVLCSGSPLKQTMPSHDEGSVDIEIQSLGLLSTPSKTAQDSSYS